MLAYFQPVIEEFPAHPVPEGCLEYPPLKLRGIMTMPGRRPKIYVFR